jgi:endoribonuclease Nob1
MKMMTVYVADASVFMYGLRFVGTVYTVPRVLSEVRSSDAEIVLQAFISEGLRIEEPLQKDIDAVTEKAKSTGDYVKLSQADIDLLAKAREVNGTLVTDDYSVQNVAARLGIETQQIRQAGIKRALSWRRRCVGCGRLYDEETICPVCGSEVKLKPAKR